MIVVPILLRPSDPSLLLIYLLYRQPPEISPKAMSLAEVDLTMYDGDLEYQVKALLFTDCFLVFALRQMKITKKDGNSLIRLIISCRQRSDSCR